MGRDRGGCVCLHLLYEYCFGKDITMITLEFSQPQSSAHWEGEGGGMHVALRWVVLHVANSVYA